MSDQVRKLAYSITELSQMSGVCRSYLYEEIKARRLIVTKAGRRSIILCDDALAWLAKLPKLSPNSTPGQGGWRAKQDTEQQRDPKGPASLFHD